MLGFDLQNKTQKQISIMHISLSTLIIFKNNLIENQTKHVK